MKFTCRNNQRHEWNYTLYWHQERQAMLSDRKIQIKIKAYIFLTLTFILLLLRVNCLLCV